MTAATLPRPAAPAVPSKAGTNPRRELARYSVGGDERVVYAQRVDGHVRLTDVGPGRSYLIDADLESMAALQALLDDYLAQAAQRQACPMARSLLADDLQALAA